MTRPTMTPSTAVSAKIYSFPPRGRFAVSSDHDPSPLGTDALLQPNVKIASGSGWYHEEAIAAEQRRKT